MRPSTGDDIWSCGDGLRGARAAVRAHARLLAAHRGKVLCWIALCVCAALAYGATARREFVAVTQVLLEPQIVARDGPEADRAFHQIALNSQQAQTEQLAIRSPRVLRAVFDALQLAGSPELSSANDGYLPRLLRRLHAVRGLDGGPEIDKQFARFTARVRTRRIASSYIVDITYEAQSARQAARVVNAVASAYARDRLIRLAGSASDGTAYHVAQEAALRAEIASVGRAAAAGEVPGAPLTNANMRFLGPAVRPLQPLFPRSPPLVGLALVFGAATVLLAAAALQNVGQPIRSGQQFVDGVGVDCIVVGRRPRRRGVAAVGEPEVGAAVRRIWAQVAARVAAEPSLRIGFAGLDHGSGAAALATELEAAMARAGLRARPGAAPGGPEGGVLVTVLPPLAAQRTPRATLRTVDLVFLVVEADRATVAEARAGVRLLRGFGTAFAGVILAPAPAG